MAFDTAKKNGNCGRIQCQRNKDNSRRGKRGVFLCRWTVRIDEKGKVISTIFLKIEGRGRTLGRKNGELVESVGDQSPSSEAPPGAREEGAKKTSGKEQLPEER